MRAVILLTFITWSHAKEANEVVNLLGKNRQMSDKEASDPVGKKINKLSDRMLTMAVPLEDMKAESDWDDTTLRKSGSVPQGQLQTLDRRSLASGLAMVPLIAIAGQANSAILREDQSAPSGDNNAYVKALVDASKKTRRPMIKAVRKHESGTQSD